MGLLRSPCFRVSQIGGQIAGITYSGAAPGEVAGVMQVNCVIPQSAVSGSWRLCDGWKREQSAGCESNSSLVNQRWLS